MFTVVTGGSGSGKSAYAEDCITGRIPGMSTLASQSSDAHVSSSPGKCTRRLYYLATMMCWDDESKKRVERHRKMRAGKGFETIERFLDLKGLQVETNCQFTSTCIDTCDDDDPNEYRNNIPHEHRDTIVTGILLECMSNLAANEVFDPNGAGDKAAEEILEGIRNLLTQCDDLVVVTNEIFSDGIEYPEETRKYQEILGKVNAGMAQMADHVVEVVYGIPVIHK